jgi:hypothetical protein
MKTLIPLLWLSLFPLFIFSSVQQSDFPKVIKGIVVDNSNNTPVEKAYIYIISGEEEALSSKDGSFEIITWQTFPVTIEINHDQYKSAKAIYKNADDRPLIKLQSK